MYTIAQSCQEKTVLPVIGQAELFGVPPRYDKRDKNKADRMEHTKGPARLGRSFLQILCDKLETMVHASPYTITVRKVQRECWSFGPVPVSSEYVREFVKLSEVFP